MKAFPEVFSIVDVETTGMRPPFSRVTDIGVLRVEDGKVAGRFESLVNPGVPIPQAITRFTGISDEMVQGAPGFDEIALQVKELLEGAVFVAHNASFDYSFIRSEFSRLRIDFSAETLCSVQLSRALFPKERGHSLDAVVRRCGVACESRHRAMPDVQAVWDFFRHVDREFDSDTVARAIAHVRGGYGASIGRGSFGDLPDKAGVYFFYGKDQELLYVGKSTNMRSRVRSHFQGGTSNKELSIRENTSSIDTIPTSGELSALLLESALIKKEGPLLNRMLRRRKVLVIAKKRLDSGGYARITLERSGDIRPDGSVMSVFRTTTQGKSVLQELSREHRVCSKLLGIENTKGPCFGSQLGTCDGACTGALVAKEHNKRLDAAFKERRIKSWPYASPVLVREAESEEKGTIFFIDDWVLFGAYRYEEGMFEPLVEAAQGFDYDTYKILARYMRKRANRKHIEAVSARDFRKLLAQCTNTDEAVIT